MRSGIAICKQTRSVGALSRRPQSSAAPVAPLHRSFVLSSLHSSIKSASVKRSRGGFVRAQLRSARRQKVELRVMSSLAAQSGVAVASSDSLLHHRLQIRCCPLPNNTLVLTAQRLAPLGPRSVAAPAAQRERYVAGEV